MTSNPAAQTAVASALAGQQGSAGGAIGPAVTPHSGPMQNGPPHTGAAQLGQQQTGQQPAGQQQTGMTQNAVSPLKPPSAGAGQEHNGDGERGTSAIPAQFARLPVELTVAIPLRGFRVRNLLAMAAGTVIATQWAHGEDLPLASGEVQLAWSEFEVVETRLAVRVTRLV